MQVSYEFFTKCPDGYKSTVLLQVEGELIDYSETISDFQYQAAVAHGTIDRLKGFLRRKLSIQISNAFIARIHQSERNSQC